MSLKRPIMKSTKTYSDNLQRLKNILETSDSILIGAGAGLSASAGFTYSGGRFRQYFSDFEEKYHFHDMYSGGFYPFDTLEDYWGYWSRFIYVNRYMDAPKPVYTTLFNLMRNKDYFVVTTNVDHCFQKAGFDKKRLFYTQGDYGLWQCSKPCKPYTYENESAVLQMIKEQKNGRIPGSLLPKCPVCGAAVTMNLRSDDTFVQDEGWYQHAALYENYLKDHEGQEIVYLELGVGYNTPGIIKYPFWQMTQENKNAVYVCINSEEAHAPSEIANRSICIKADIGAVLEAMRIFFVS